MQQKAFNELKRIFTSKLVLAALDLDKEFRVEADASNYTTGGVLSMKCSDEKWRPVAFISKSLSDTERNYEIYNKEMLAVVRYLCSTIEIIYWLSDILANTDYINI